MYKGVINFTRRDCDLDHTPEYWQGESYSERIKTIQAVVQEKTTYLPTKKLQSVREGVFKVPSTITVEQLVECCLTGLTVKQVRASITIPAKASS